MTQTALPHGGDHPADPGQGYERNDTRGRAIFIGLAVSILFITAVSFALNELFVSTREEVVQEQVASVNDPRLAEVNARAEHNLNSYEWVDSSHGVAHIPVDRAMQLMVQESYLGRSLGERDSTR